MKKSQALLLKEKTMNRIPSNIEKYLWNNFKMYLMQYKTCLLDNILEIQNPEANFPIDRYKDFLVELDRHIGLGSYTIQQPTMFSYLPYVTVNIEPVDYGSCNFGAVMGFDIVFATDTPPTDDQSTRYLGNSSEAIASFRANVLNGLDEIFYKALDAEAYTQLRQDAFFDRLREQTLPNPTNPEETKLWRYNVIGQVDAENTITSVSQLKREDRSSGLSVFHVQYTLDINRLYSPDGECGC